MDVDTITLSVISLGITSDFKYLLNTLDILLYTVLSSSFFIKFIEFLIALLVLNPNLLLYF